MVSAPMTTSDGFTLGDVVSLKSGSPPMTVLGFEQAATRKDELPGPILIKCCGFRPDGGYLEFVWPSFVLASAGPSTVVKPVPAPATSSSSAKS